jgi:hypothetical protein
MYNLFVIKEIFDVLLREGILTTSRNNVLKAFGTEVWPQK